MASSELGRPRRTLLLAPVMLFSYFLLALSPAIFGFVASALGRFLFIVHFRRSIVAANLRLALPELSAEARDKLARQIYRHLGRTFLEIARNFALTKEQMLREVILSPDDRQRIESLVGRGKGVVFVSAHIANWELLAMGMAAHGFSTSIVVKKMSSPISQSLIERQRNKTGLDIIYSGGTIEKMREKLRAGRAIGFMMDQNITGKKGIRCNFFGVPASSIRALGALVRESGAAVIPICAFRRPDGKQNVFLGPELKYLAAEDAAPEERSLREEWLNAQNYQTAIENLVRMHPEQWLWIHRRWKARRDPLNPSSAHLDNRESAT